MGSAGSEPGRAAGAQRNPRARSSSQPARLPSRPAARSPLSSASSTFSSKGSGLFCAAAALMLCEMRTVSDRRREGKSTALSAYTTALPAGAGGPVSAVVGTQEEGGGCQCSTSGGAGAWRRLSQLSSGRGTASARSVPSPPASHPARLTDVGAQEDGAGAGRQHGALAHPHIRGKQIDIPRV